MTAHRFIVDVADFANIHSSADGSRTALPIRCRRSAIMLIEVMTAAVLASLVVGVVISLLVSVKQRDRSIQFHGLRGEQLLQLAETLRGDMRLAGDVSQPDARTLLVTQFADYQIRYEAGPGGCRRAVGSPSGDHLQAEMFSMGGCESWTVERDESGKRPSIAVTLHFAAVGSGEANSVALFVRAVLGADAPGR